MVKYGHCSLNHGQASTDCVMQGYGLAGTALFTWWWLSMDKLTQKLSQRSPPTASLELLTVIICCCCLLTFLFCVVLLLHVTMGLGSELQLQKYRPLAAGKFRTVCKLQYCCQASWYCWNVSSAGEETIKVSFVSSIAFTRFSRWGWKHSRWDCYSIKHQQVWQLTLRNQSRNTLCTWYIRDVSCPCVIVC